MRQIKIRSSAEWLVGLAGLNLFVIFFYLRGRDDVLHPVWIYLFLLALAFGFYAYAGNAVQNRIAAHTPRLLWMILALGIVFRLLLVTTPPSLSTDILRYVWDGRLTCHWINPYRWSPWDPRLASLRDTLIWQPMEYKAYQTVYMPISQFVFALCYALFRSSLTGFKAVFALFDIGIMLLIAQVLKRLGKEPSRVIWYAWCPLPIVEVALAGHQDVTGVFFLVLAIFLLTRRNYRWAALSLAAAGLTKGFALLLLPLFARRAGARLLVVMCAAIIYLGMPLWVYLPDFLHGMQQYLGYVHVNAGLFALADKLISFVSSKHFAWTSRLTDLAILSTLAWSIWTRPLTTEELIRRAIIVLAVCLLTVPSLFPWYVIWLLPLVVIYGNRPSGAFLCLSGTVSLVYVYYLDRSVSWWVPVIEYVPVYFLLWREWRSGYWRPAILEGGAGSAGESAMESVGGTVEAGTTSVSAARAAGPDATW